MRFEQVVGCLLALWIIFMGFCFWMVIHYTVGVMQ